MKKTISILLILITMTFSQDFQKEFEKAEREWKAVKTCAIIGCITSGFLLVWTFGTRSRLRCLETEGMKLEKRIHNINKELFANGLDTIIIRE